MAFTSTQTGTSYFGNKKIVYGTFASSAGGTGGDIATGLEVCEGIFLQAKGSAVTTNESVVNETFPVSGGNITIVTDANLTGTYMAFGY